MRKPLSLLIVIFINITIVRVLASGFQANARGIMPAFLFMLPATVSMILALVFAADRVHYRKLDWPAVPAFVASILLFASSVLLLVFGKPLIPQVDISSCFSQLMFFLFFPVSMFLVDKVKRVLPSDAEKSLEN